MNAGWLFLYLLGVFQVSSAVKYDNFNLVVFGDSMSDNGHDFRYNGDKHGFRRFSDGPNYAKYLAWYLGISAANVHNYAYSGAESGMDNYYFQGWSGVTWQVQEYLKDNKNQIAPNTLVLFQAGGANDILSGNTQKILKISTNANKSLHLLASARADNFVFLYILPCQRMPYFKANATTRAAIERTVNATNQNLQEKVIEPFVQSREISFRTVNVEDIWAEVEKMFVNTEDFFTHHRNDTEIADTKDYAWYDEFHPTTGVHKMIATAILDTLGGQTLYGSGVGQAFLHIAFVLAIAMMVRGGSM